jgi:hypothetical protein
VLVRVFHPRSRTKIQNINVKFEEQKTKRLILSHFLPKIFAQADREYWTKSSEI